jgi:hypothetical protein
MTTRPHDDAAACPQCEQYRVAILRAGQHLFGLLISSHRPAPDEVVEAFGELQQALGTGVAFDAPLDSPSPLQSVITWVPVSERLPEAGPMGEAFLCYDADTGRVDRCVWVSDIEKWHDGDDLVEPDEYTHWTTIKLPTPRANEEPTA